MLASLKPKKSKKRNIYMGVENGSGSGSDSGSDSSEVRVCDLIKNAPSTSNDAYSILNEKLHENANSSKKRELSEFFNTTRIPAKYLDDHQLSNSDVEEYYGYDATLYDGFSLMEDAPVRNYSEHRVSFESFIKKELESAPSIDESNTLNEIDKNNDQLVEPSCTNDLEGEVLELDCENESIEAEIEQEEIEQAVPSGHTRCIFVKHYHPYSIPIEEIKEYMLDNFYSLMGQLIREPIIYRNSNFDHQMGFKTYRENYIFRFEFAVPKEEVQHIIDNLIYFGRDYMQDIRLYIRVIFKLIYNILNFNIIYSL